MKLKLFVVDREWGQLLLQKCDVGGGRVVFERRKIKRRHNKIILVRLRCTRATRGLLATGFAIFQNGQVTRPTPEWASHQTEPKRATSYVSGHFITTDLTCISHLHTIFFIWIFSYLIRLQDGCVEDHIRSQNLKQIFHNFKMNLVKNIFSLSKENFVSYVLKSYKLA